jgi:hypothetical protein
MAKPKRCLNCANSAAVKNGRVTVTSRLVTRACFYFELRHDFGEAMEKLIEGDGHTAVSVGTFEDDHADCNRCKGDGVRWIIQKQFDQGAQQDTSTECRFPVDGVRGGALRSERPEDQPRRRIGDQSTHQNRSEETARTFFTTFIESILLMRITADIQFT